MIKNRISDKSSNSLEFDKNRYRVKTCPCGKSNKDGKFVPYTGHDDKGYCHSCGETFLPDMPMKENWNNSEYQRHRQVKPKIDYIPREMYEKQLVNGKHLYDNNNFIQWLRSPRRGLNAFDNEVIHTLIETYQLGNSGQDKFKGWVLFPYIDINGNIRNIKAMDYDPNTGKRIKEPRSRVHYLGKEILSNPKANLECCFYGEHLLSGNKKPVKVFESEATATYAAPFFPDFVCLATGGKNGCKWTEWRICKVLQNRIIILYPDIDAHQEWEKISDVLNEYGINVQVSSIIIDQARNFATANGIDFQDLIKQKYDLRDILKVRELVAFRTSNSKASSLFHLSNINSTDASKIDRKIIKIEKALSDDEIAYKRLVTKNPHLETLVEVFDLITP